MRLEDKEEGGGRGGDWGREVELEGEAMRGAVLEAEA